MSLMPSYTYEPSDKMNNEGIRAGVLPADAGGVDVFPYSIYRAMLAAAPKSKATK